MRGVITHVSDPHKNTYCTTTKYIWPEVQESIPSLPITLVSIYHFRLAFRKLLTTSGQSSSTAVRIHPR